MTDMQNMTNQELNTLQTSLYKQKKELDVKIKEIDNIFNERYRKDAYMVVREIAEKIKQLNKLGYDLMYGGFLDSICLFDLYNHKTITLNDMTIKE